MSKIKDLIADCDDLADRFDARIEWAWQTGLECTVLVTSDDQSHTFTGDASDVYEWVHSLTAAQPHWHYLSGMAGYIPESVECLGSMDVNAAADYLKDRVEDNADGDHMGDPECFDDDPCDACSAALVCASAIADGDHVHGLSVYISPYVYMAIEQVSECDGKVWE